MTSLDAFGWIRFVTVPRHELVTGQPDRIPALRQRENSEERRIELERAQARYRELTRARPSGAWSVGLYCP